MKISNNAQQNNFLIDTDYYTESEIREMFNQDEVGFISTHTFYRVCTDYAKWLENDKPEIRIFASRLERIELELEDGFYVLVAYGINGKRYHINL